MPGLVQGEPGPRTPGLELREGSTRDPTVMSAPSPPLRKWNTLRPALEGQQQAGGRQSIADQPGKGVF